MEQSLSKATLPPSGNERERNKDQLLCSSCDSCRAKKIKCDGKTPCEACMIAFVRKNKIRTAEEVDPTKISCVYSPAKRRGPPPKRTLYRETREQRDGKRKREEDEEQSTASLGRAPEEAVLPSAAGAALNNLDTASILNLLGGALNPAASVASMPPSIDPMSSVLQQTLLSSLGSSVNNQSQSTSAMSLDQGLVGGASADSRGNNNNNIMSNPPPPSTASQQLAYLLLQLQQQLHVHLQQLQEHLQHQVRQQVQQQHEPPRSQRSTTVAESLTSSDDSNVQLLQKEVERLRRRVNDLELEYAQLKQRLESLRLEEGDEEMSNWNGDDL